MQALTDCLLALFLALGSAWFAVDLVRKLRAPATDHATRPQVPATVPHAVAASDPAPARAAEIAPVPAPVPAVIAAASAPAAAVPAPASLPAPNSPPPALDPAHLAVIAATIHHLFRGRARVASIVTAGAHASAVDWAREGRRDIFSSHRLR